MKNLNLIDDPNVTIPPAVKAAAARAEAARLAAYPAPAEPPVVTSEGNPPPVVVAEVPPAPAPPVVPVVPAAEEIDWEHRFNSMKGRHDKAQESIRQMSDQITSMQHVIATMSTAPVPGAPAPAAKPLLTEQEVGEYGADFLSVVGKKAREEFNPEITGLRQKIEELQSQLSNVGGNIAASARDQMLSALDDVKNGVPNWKEINKDPKFLQWLALPDLLSGAIRHNLLKAAWERNITPSVLAFFKGFLAEEAALDPAERGPDLTPVAPLAPEKVPLATFAAPGRAKSAAEIPAEKPVITPAQIAKFYADSAAGKYRGNETEQKRLEAQIFDAQREGRIIR